MQRRHRALPLVHADQRFRIERGHLAGPALDVALEPRGVAVLDVGDATQGRRPLWIARPIRLGAELRRLLRLGPIVLRQVREQVVRDVGSEQTREPPHARARS